MSSAFYDSAEEYEEEEEEEFDDYVDPYVLMKAVPPYSSIPAQFLKPNLLPPKISPHTHTLVLDLDETLVHCYLEKPSQFDITFEIDDGMKYDVYLCFRPYVFYFLETMSQYYELIVFTAGIRVYGELICDLFNSETKLIQYCLNREHCICVNDGMYIKDLRSLNRDLVCLVVRCDGQSKVIILDNSLYSFAFNVNNGIPISSWYSDPSDKKLYQLIPLLRSLSMEDDVRDVLRDMFKIQDILDSYDDFYQFVRLFEICAIL